MKKEREVPKKNYFYLLLMLLSVVLITLVIFDINKKYQNRKLNSSYLEGYISQININEIDNVLSEPSSDLFILITKSNNNEIYRFEMELKKIIKDYDLRDNFIYIDSTDVDTINKKFDIKIKKIPAIIYIKNGELVKYIDSSVNILNAGEFEKLLDEYEVK